MSRTNRKLPPNSRCMRKPHHLNEESQLIGLLTDCYTDDIPLAKRNRIHKRLTNLPDAWDDIIISSLYEQRSI